MDSRNNESNGVILVMALFIAILHIFFALVAAAALFITAFFSIISVIAILRDGVVVGGEYVSAHQGKMFFARGFIGGFILPIFVLVFLAIIGEQIRIEPYWIWLAGFVLGSTGGEIILANLAEENAKASQAAALPPLTEERPTLPPEALPAQPERPFRYASWDDEGGSE